MQQGDFESGRTKIPEEKVAAKHSYLLIMKITVKRKKQFNAALAPMLIYINGGFYSEIKNGQKLYIDRFEDITIIKIEFKNRYIYKTAEINDIRDGDKIYLKFSLFNNILYSYSEE